MAGRDNAAPIVIKRKKIIAGGGHHGGAWKVAYADFVTAMMAFFMLMWLLNATTEKQRKGLADYFDPTIAVSRVSGGGSGMFGGDSVLKRDEKAENGKGAPASVPTEQAQPADPATDAAEEELLQSLEEMLLARSGESMTMESLKRHVVTRVTDEGLVIELFDLPDAALFLSDRADLSPVARSLLKVVAEVLQIAENRIAVNGYVRSYPAPLADNPVWNLSAARAQSVRVALEASGLATERMARVSGHADRKPVLADPTAVRNNRIEVVLLRRNR